jgi:hypothetical protein
LQQRDKYRDAPCAPDFPNTDPNGLVPHRGRLLPGTNFLSPHFPLEAVARRSTRRLSRIAKGLRTRCSKRAHARIAKGDGLIDLILSAHLAIPGGFLGMIIEPPPSVETSLAERAIDTATDVSRTIGEVSAALHVAVDRLSQAIAASRAPGKPLSTIAAITREAPLASLFVAFIFGVAVARRG